MSRADAIVTLTDEQFEAVRQLVTAAVEREIAAERAVRVALARNARARAVLEGVPT